MENSGYSDRGLDINIAPSRAFVGMHEQSLCSRSYRCLGDYSRDPSSDIGRDCVYYNPEEFHHDPTVESPSKLRGTASYSEPNTTALLQHSLLVACANTYGMPRAHHWYLVTGKVSLVGNHLLVACLGTHTPLVLNLLVACPYGHTALVTYILVACTRTRAPLVIIFCI